MKTDLKAICALPWGVHCGENYEQPADVPANNFHFTQKTLRIRGLCGDMRKLQAKPQNLCIYGYRGIGKTALANKIAEILQRPLQTIKFNWWTRPKDLIGSTGSMGSIMRAVKTANCCNPVILLENVDKIKNKKVLKILRKLSDPKTKKAFVDRSLGVPFDLSNVMFIAEMKYVEGCPLEFKKQRELVDFFRVFGVHFYFKKYSTGELVEIIQEAFLPSELAKRGMESYQFHLQSSVFTKEYLEELVLEYVVPFSWKQVRHVLLMNISWIALNRKRWVNRIVGNMTTKKLLKPFNIFRWPWRISTRRCFQQENAIRVMALGVHELFWRGFDTPIYASFSKTRELSYRHLPINDWKSMTDCAYNHLMSNARKYRIPVENREKEFRLEYSYTTGPSAGCAVFMALFSLYADRPLRCDTALTGAFDLSGRPKRIGGVRWKVEAAHKNGFRRIVLPLGNKKDFENEVDEKLERAMEIVYVDSVEDLIRALVPITKNEKQEGPAGWNGKGILLRFRKYLLGI